MLWEVGLLSAPYRTFLYCSPEYFSKDFWKRGLRVVVPFRNGFKLGVLLKQKGTNSNVIDNIRPIFWPYEIKPLLSSEYIDMIVEISKHYMVTPSEVLSVALPARVRRLNTMLQLEAEGMGRVRLRDILGWDEKNLLDLAQLWQQGAVKLKVINRKEDQNDQDPLIEFVDWNTHIPRRNKRQTRIVEYLWLNGPQRLTRLRGELGSWVKEVIEKLCKRGVLKKVNVYERSLSDGANTNLVGIYLTEEQRKSVDILIRDLNHNSNRIRLLFGVTGSGKTQIYIHLLRECLKSGGSGLLLVPEVALGYHIYQEVRKYIKPWKCLFYHGYLSQKEREKIFLELAETKEPFVVVGTRSSVFLPHLKWRVIIVDEEHDPSYKQEDRFFYNAKDVVFYLSKKFRSILLLGSATPDIKTYYSAKNGKIPLLVLKNRVNRQQLPEVELVELTKEEKKEAFTSRAKELLTECIGKGEQAIILLNRRGYAPVLFCLSCRNVLKCDYCSVSLTYYKGKDKALCHYCGMSKEFPSPCPYCGSMNYLPLSEGTEKVEEYLKVIIGAEKKILRLDRDIVRNQQEAEKTLKRFAKKEAQILLGTQMCSKGYHFPDVTLVIVVDGDIGLNIPDYRASERIFSLLVQASGRAGRGEKRGRVLIQTRNPDHYFWKHVINGDYDGFYKDEIALRKKFNYPPFSKLALIRISFPKKWMKGLDKIKKLEQIINKIPPQEDVMVLGPSPAPIKMIKKKIRYHCIVKARSWVEIRKVYSFITSQLDFEDPRFKMVLDMDPFQII